MRPTKELLQIMLKNIDKLYTGLCGLIMCLASEGIIGLDEYNHLKQYIGDHRPINLRFFSFSAFYWKPKAVKPRVRWLKRHIRRNK